MQRARRRGPAARAAVCSRTGRGRASPGLLSSRGSPGGVSGGVHESGRPVVRRRRGIERAGDLQATVSGRNSGRGMGGFGASGLGGNSGGRGGAGALPWMVPGAVERRLRGGAEFSWRRGRAGAALGFCGGCGWEDEGGAGLRGQLKGGPRASWGSVPWRRGAILGEKGGVRWRAGEGRGRRAMTGGPGCAGREATRGAGERAAARAGVGRS